MKLMCWRVMIKQQIPDRVICEQGTHVCVCVCVCMCVGACVCTHACAYIYLA